MIKRVAITGPESTGKSDLTVRLAEHFRTVWVPEYARMYLEDLNRDYYQEDILLIAQGQKKLSEEIEPRANRIMFSDTEMLVAKIWSEFKYGSCHPWILWALENQQFDLYLLTNIDLPWRDDPLREHPDKREVLFHIYLKELKNLGKPFEIISGSGHERFNSALEAINKRLNI
mgnify:CR=1 FL=1